MGLADEPEAYCPLRKPTTARRGPPKPCPAGINTSASGRHQMLLQSESHNLLPRLAESAKSLLDRVPSIKVIKSYCRSMGRSTCPTHNPLYCKHHRAYPGPRQAKS